LYYHRTNPRILCTEFEKKSASFIYFLFFHLLTPFYIWYRSQYRPCAAAAQQTAAACQLTRPSDVIPAQPIAHATPLPPSPPPLPPRDVTAAASAFASSLFVRSRLDEIIERELRHLNAREEELAKSNPTTTSTDDLSDATSITSTESDEGFFDKMSRHEIEAGGD
jgi:hypothetical protein